MIALRIILAVAAFGVSSAVSAADDPEEPRREDLALLASFSSCIVDRARDDAEAVLEGDFREEGYGREMARLARKHSRCLGSYRGQLRAAGVLFAGALAEE